MHNSPVPISIVYEDDALYVIAKPAGIVVNTAETVEGATIQKWSEERMGIKNRESRIDLPAGKAGNQELKEPAIDFVNRAGIVHRLDKDTSGALLIAKTPQAFVDLQKQFASRTIKKTYITLVHGILPAKSGSIDLPVGRLPWKRQKFGIIPDGKAAATSYEVVNEHPLDPAYSLLRVYPETGRTHQIRVHLKYLGHPVVGDRTYGGRKRTKKDEKLVPRMFLHAQQITFLHPVSHTPITVDCPLPDDLQHVLDTLELDLPRWQAGSRS